jgi:hypothetical protein
MEQQVPTNTIRAPLALMLPAQIERKGPAMSAD